MRVLGIHLAPLVIPLERRLQTYAVFHHVSTFFFLGISSTIFMVFLLFTPLCWLVLPYWAWYIYDFNQSSRGGRRFEWARRNIIWTWLRDYFPVRLIKTADLDPAHNYIFGSHPHGIMGMGAFSNFLTEANGFSELYPGITMTLLSLKLMHYFPIYREYIMALGVCDVSKESIQCLMKRKGQAITIVIGGAKEALDASSGCTRLVLKNRKGFVKLAIQTGAYLVPTFSFGENEIYTLVNYSPPGSRLRELQRKIQQKVGVAPIVINGRGVFNYTLGFLPYRKPITTVVGHPIPVVQNPFPSQEEVDEVHDRYLSELKSLFDEYKERCGFPDEKLEFVD
ncbi:2-acylglycerol O-acyltransferase 2-A [Hypsibius exemplaris]|uniref:Acyltransferase n=1 Tax=Hypsibius exemplaris TaxID=2072580 RepID=A0A1W0WGA3_HYPEX|nr:2-acylglycerol O-acyltransferase 2-A [Hypsibius exemplaris]